MNIKPFLIFSSGLLIGAGATATGFVIQMKKDHAAKEVEIAEIKKFYAERHEERAHTLAMELVKQKIFRGELVYPQSSLDHPDVVTEAEERYGQKLEEIPLAEEDAESDPEASGKDPPYGYTVKHWIDSHDNVVTEFVKEEDTPDSKEPKLRDVGGPSQKDLYEAQAAMMGETSLAEARGNYVRYSKYSRSQAKQDTRSALAEYEAEREEQERMEEVKQQYDDEGHLLDENGMTDSAEANHVSPEEYEASLQRDLPYQITQEQFDEEYTLYEKETLFYYILDNVLAFENMEVVEDPAMYVGTIAPVSLFSRAPGGEILSMPIFIRNHKLGMDLCVYPSLRSYAEALEFGG